MIHAVKCLPEYFAPLNSGAKSFEVRKNDRPYAVGDYLAVNEFAPFEYEFSSEDMRERFSRTSDNGRFSGQSLLFKITFVLNDRQYCKDGTVILGLKRCCLDQD